VDKRVLPASIAAEVHSMLEGVIGQGTGTEAAISGVDVVGKTGTTTNYADAWFVGWTPQLTVAVWVGYPRGAVSMSTAYGGSPVEGGTYPAIIWQNFMVQALSILSQEQSQYGPHRPGQTQASTAPPTSGTGTLGVATSQTGGTAGAATTLSGTTPSSTSTTAAQSTATAPTATAPANAGGTQAPSSATPASPTPPASPNSGATGGAGLGGGG